ncbi:MAG: hypothetical protein V1914_04355 [archaeon]
MNELEQTILAEIQNSKEANDPLSNAIKKKNTKNKPKIKISKYLTIPLAATGIILSTYYISTTIWATKYRPVAIPVAIWGICGTSYTIRKLTNK